MRKRSGDKATGGLQTVFRLKGAKAREKTTNQSEPHKSSFNSRRSHTKSRTGCQNCKLRRVKCDETRIDGCLRCRQHGIDCDYLESHPSDGDKGDSCDDTQSVFAASNNSNPSSAAMTPTKTEVAAPTPFLSPPTPFRYDMPTEITPYSRTLRHFELFTCPTITSSDGVRIFETSVLAIATENDYLMHAVLGTAAAHLAWQANLRDSPIEYRKHQQAEAYHWHRAVGKFRARIDSLETRTTETADALISTCMLLGIHSYFLLGENDGPSFVWRSDDDRPGALRWLSLQSGFGLLLRLLGGRAALSAWLEVISSAVPGEAGFQGDVTRGVYGDFLDLCGVDQYSTAENNPYFKAIQDLFALLQMGRPTMASFAPLMAFMGRLVGPFQELLCKRDSAAMLIVAYWLGLVHQLQLWWILARAERECTAIVMFLQHDPDPRIKRLLQFPAESMGVNLSGE